MADVKDYILDYLQTYHTGESKAIFGGKLSSVFKIDESTLIKIINQLRIENNPVCSNYSGYFYACNTKEIDETIEHLTNRTSGMERAKEGLIIAKKFLEKSNEREKL